jgi:hypothetical protein
MKIDKIVFIDGAVGQADLLVAGVKPGVRAVLLDPRRDGLGQIARHLADSQSRDLAAIDIVTHGSDGELSLGGHPLNSGTIAAHRRDLATIGAALRPDGVIQLYSCDVARDADGIAFLRQVSRAAGGAGIAAASHAVGGGDWALDVRVGAVPAGNPFTAATRQAFPGALGTTTGRIYLDPRDAEGILSNSDAALLDLTEAGASRTGTGTIEQPTGAFSNAPILEDPANIAVDPAHGQLFFNYVGGAAGTTATPGLYRMAAGGGGLTEIYQTPTADSTGDGGELNGIAADEANGTVYFTQLELDSTGSNAVASRTGVFAVSESGTNQVATQILVDPAPPSLANPTSMAIDAVNNLAFFVDDQSFPGGTGTVELYVGGLTGISATPQAVLTIGNFTDLANSNSNNELTTALAVDAATHTIYYSAEID